MNILITGGTGYLGRALAKHALGKAMVNRVAIFSRNEAAQAAMRAEMQDERLRFFIGDVRDQPRLERAMYDQGAGRTDVVIHAAALKRVEVGEYNPTEMVKTNVMGTMNVINAAQSTRAGKMVLISSDKACAPLNAYGATKLTAEKLALAAHAECPRGPEIVVCRYGNVAGSTGSVIPTWRNLPFGTVGTLTDPAATRFWMPLRAAVDLVWRASVDMNSGRTIVPSLPAYALADLAQAMGVPLRKEPVGLGPGEKLHEEMISAAEAPHFYRVGEFWLKGDRAPYPTGVRDDRKPLERRQTSMSSANADRLSVAELIELLRGVQ